MAAARASWFALPVTKLSNVRIWFRRERRLKRRLALAGGRVEHELHVDRRLPVVARERLDAARELALDPVELETVGRGNPQRARLLVKRQRRQRLDPRLELLRRQLTFELSGRRMPEILHRYR